MSAQGRRIGQPSARHIAGSPVKVVSIWLVTYAYQPPEVGEALISSSKRIAAGRTNDS